MKKKTKTTARSTKCDWNKIASEFFRLSTEGKKGRGIMKCRALCAMYMRRDGRD